MPKAPSRRTIPAGSRKLRRCSIERCTKSTGLRPQNFQADVDARVRKTLTVLGDLAADFAAQPGAKSLVWISHGVPFTTTGLDGMLRDYTSEVLRLGMDFSRSGIVIYAVGQEERTISDANSATTMQQLAGVTAGQWLPGNSTDQAIVQALREGRATYQVGFAPPLERWTTSSTSCASSPEEKASGCEPSMGTSGICGRPTRSSVSPWPRSGTPTIPE